MQRHSRRTSVRHCCELWNWRPPIGYDIRSRAKVSNTIIFKCDNVIFYISIFDLLFPRPVQPSTARNISFIIFSVSFLVSHAISSVRVLYFSCAEGHKFLIDILVVIRQLILALLKFKLICFVIKLSRIIFA